MSKCQKFVNLTSKIFSMNSHDDLISEYYFLKDHIPVNIDNRYQDLMVSVENLRHRLISSQRNRIVTDFNLQRMKNGEVDLQELKEILNTTITPRCNINPSTSQRSSLFMSYIYKNIPIFAKAVIQYHKNPNFEYLIKVCIPALFCNFCCSEVMEHCNLFYSFILNQSKPKIAIEVISPFFCSIIGFPYVQLVMDQYIPRMTSEKRILNKNQTQSLQTQIQLLLSIMTKSLKSLSNYILILMQIIYSQKWSLEDVKTLFFDRYFIYLATIYINQTPYQIYLDNLLEVLNYFRNNDESCKKLIGSINTSWSLMNVPHIFMTFNHSYINILLSPFDITVLMKCLKNSVDGLPYTVREIDFKSESPNSPFFIYYYKNKPKNDLRTDMFIFQGLKPVYPQNSDYLSKYIEIKTNSLFTKNPYEVAKETSKDQDFIEFSLRQSVAECREQALIFENFINFKLHEKILQNWFDVNVDHMNIFRKYALTFIKPQRIEIIYQDLIPIVEYPENLNHIYVKCVMQSILNVYNDKKPFFNTMNKLWQDVLGSWKTVVEEIDLSKFSKMVQTTFWDSVQIFNAIDYVPFHDRFFLLIEFMKYLTIIRMYSNKQDTYLLLKHIISFSKPETLLHSFVIYTTCFITDLSLTATLSADTMNSWTLFHNFLVNFVSDEMSMDLTNMISELQDLMNHFIHN